MEKGKIYEGKKYFKYMTQKINIDLDNLGGIEHSILTILVQGKRDYLGLPIELKF